MSDGTKMWLGFLFYSGMGYGTIYLASHRHADWFTISDDSGREHRSAFVATICAVGWPITLTVAVGAEMLPPDGK